MIREKPIAIPGMDEGVGHRAGLGDPGNAPARQPGRHVADVRGAVGDEVDDAHAVRPEQGQAVLAGDPGDLGLHRGGGRPPSTTPPPGMTTAGTPAAAAASVTDAARNGLSATTATSGRSGRASRLG